MEGSANDKTESKLQTEREAKSNARAGSATSKGLEAGRSQ